MLKLTVIATIAALCCGSAMAAEDYAFVGTWDCEVSTFTFTNTTYDPGESPLTIKSVEGDASGYVLTFDDGYQIGLSDVTATSMQWLSMETGDGFSCTKQ